jgi:UDP-N-acetylmuramoylalanine--D-glutamate ligase
MLAVIGTGVTGLSVARFLRDQGLAFVLFDTRSQPPAREQIAREFAGVHCQFGPWEQSLLNSVDEIIVSPGVALSTPAIAAARAAGVPVIGDIELFTRYAQAPIVAITGSNGKSTVTTLVGQMAQVAGLDVAVGGNLGTPALELLSRDRQLYVLELSSFQLEAVNKLGAEVACILNMSADHLDRYPDMPAYHRAKQRIYYGARQVVVNRTDTLTQPPLADAVTRSSFAGAAEFNNMGLRQHQGESWLCQDLTPLIKASELPIVGQHNIDNALAALAIGKAAGLPLEAMLTALRHFKGLPHRCRRIAQLSGVTYVDDSKGTNVGATLAAINGLASATGKLVVILGGVAKEQNFAPLLPALKAHARACILMGQDAPILAGVLQNEVPYVHADTMIAAVAAAHAQAQQGDCVLLSPACASLDMYDNYQARGEAFCAAVEGLQ